MATTIIKSSDSDNQALVDSTGHLLVTGNVSATNPSVAPTGTTAPTSATEIAGIDPSGNLHAVAVDNNGAVLVTGSLSVGSGFSTITPGYPTQVSVGTTSTQLFPANTLRKYAHIFNNSSQAIFVQYQVSAALNQGIKIAPGSFFTLDSDNLWLGIVNAIGLMSGQLIDVLEGE